MLNSPWEMIEWKVYSGQGMGMYNNLGVENKARCTEIAR